MVSADISKTNTLSHTHTIRDLWMLQIKHLLFKDTLESVLAVKPMSFQNYK